MMYFATLKEVGERNFLKSFHINKWKNLSECSTETLEQRCTELEEILTQYKSEIDNFDDKDMSKESYAFFDVYYEIKNEYTSLKAEIQTRMFPKLIELRLLSESRRETRKNRMGA